MSTRAALATGTVSSFAITGAWSWMASLTIGPAPPLRLGQNLAADYAQLAAAPAGNGWELFAVIVTVYTACLLVSGCRCRRRGGA